MTEQSTATREPETFDPLPHGDTHPRGTLVIIALFALFFVAVWLGTYVFVFLGRGAVHP